MEVITLNTEMMYVKQLLNRKSSKFTAVSLSQPITARCFQLSGSTFHVLLWPEPLLPCLFCSLDLPQALTLPLPRFLPLPPSFVHFPCSPGDSSLCVGPIPSKVHDQEPLYFHLSLGHHLLTGMCGQNVLRYVLLIWGSSRNGVC